MKIKSTTLIVSILAFIFLFHGSNYSSFFGNAFGIYAYYFAVMLCAAVGLLFLKYLTVTTRTASLFLVSLTWAAPPLLFSFFYDSAVKNIGEIFLIVLIHLASFVLMLWLVRADRTVHPMFLVRRAIIAFTLINVIMVLYFAVTDVSKITSFSGLYGNRNVLAVTLCFLLAFWFYARTSVRLHRTAIHKLIEFSIPVLITLFAVLTLSSKGLIGVGMVWLFYIYFSPITPRNRILTLCSGIITFLIISTSGVLDDSVERLANRFGIDNSSYQSRNAELAEMSQLERVSLIKSSISFISDRPLMGYGFRESENLVQSVFGRTTYSHVNYLEIAFSGGFLSLILYYGPILFMLTFAFIQAIKTRRTIYYFVCLILVILLSMDFAMVSYKDFIFVFVKVFSFCVVFNKGFASAFDRYNLEKHDNN